MTAKEYKEFRLLERTAYKALNNVTDIDRVERAKLENAIWNIIDYLQRLLIACEKTGGYHDET